jgi:hypothetical protein
MRFNYNSGFEDWAEENGYDWDNWVDQTTLLEKSYSKIIQFYIKKADSDSYAEVKAYQSSEEGLFDISIEREGLKQTEEVVSVVNRIYN